MCYKAEHYVSPAGKKPVLEFIKGQEKDTQNWLVSGILLLERQKGILNTGNVETKHIRNKIFELKFKKLPVRILFAYNPFKRGFIILLHAITKKRQDLKNSDIAIAESRYNETIKWYEQRRAK